MKLLSKRDQQEMVIQAHLAVSAHGIGIEMMMMMSRKRRVRLRMMIPVWLVKEKEQRFGKPNGPSETIWMLYGPLLSTLLTYVSHRVEMIVPSRFGGSMSLASLLPLHEPLPR